MDDGPAGLDIRVTPQRVGHDVRGRPAARQRMKIITRTHTRTHRQPRADPKRRRRARAPHAMRDEVEQKRPPDLAAPRGREHGVVSSRVEARNYGDPHPPRGGPVTVPPNFAPRAPPRCWPPIFAHGRAGVERKIHELPSPGTTRHIDMRPQAPSSRTCMYNYNHAR